MKGFMLVFGAFNNLTYRSKCVNFKVIGVCFFLDFFIRIFIDIPIFLSKYVVKAYFIGKESFL